MIVAMLLQNESVAEQEIPATRDRGGYERRNSLKLYLSEIGRIKLLTPEEEVQLAERIKNGDKQAREQMIKANLRLVVKIAHDYENIGLPLLDLISEGNIGLIKAVERFDPSKGARLSTYASWWIKQSIKRALANQSKTIRLPVHMVDKISKMNRAARLLQEQLGREPTDEELAEEMGISPEKVGWMRMAAVRPASLDAPVGDDVSDSFGDLVADEKADSPRERFEEKAVSKLLRQIIRKLAPREAEILAARYGLNGGRQKTLDEVGEQFKVTRERVRQLQNRALRKLRGALKKLDGARPVVSV